jgi:hypothetical protein
MDIQGWLDSAVADAKRRGLPQLEPLLQALARSTEALRAANVGGPSADELAKHPPPSPRNDD